MSIPVGWSMNDVKTIKTFLFLDPNVFSLENFRTLSEQMLRANGMPLREAIRVPNTMVNTPLAAAAGMLCLVRSQWQWRSLLVCLSTPIVVIAVIVGLAVSLKTPPERV